MHLDWTLATGGPVTLVRVRLRNERATDRQVRLQNRLDGPVLPPRRHGKAEAGWDRDGVTTVVPAGETVALGYACPAPEAEPPVVVDEVGAVQPAGVGESPVDDAVRGLDGHRPPRDVLEADSDSQANEATAVAQIPNPGREADANTTPAASAGRPENTLPDDAQKLLTTYRTRIETAEALGAVGVPEATALLAANDGLAGVESLGHKLDADARALRALAAAAATLATRAEAATPPTDALRRLS